MYSLNVLRFLLSVGSWVQARECYYRGGDQAAADSPCDTQSIESSCCGSADICLSNKLCYSPSSNTLQRGSCTDPTWDNGACANTICGNETSSVEVKECPNNPGAFYCGNNSSQCTNQTESYTLSPGYFADARNTTVITSTIGLQATITYSPPSATATPKASSGSGSGSGSTTNCPSKVSLAAVGAGVGIPLTLLLLLCLLFIWAMQRRHRNFVSASVELDQRYDAKGQMLGNGNGKGKGKGKLGHRMSVQEAYKEIVW
ncbi:hypothetical protein MMC25_004641 [Agyrium rufum]|nr:hypothetical protein [Agyrium rufum]